MAQVSACKSKWSGSHSGHESVKVTTMLSSVPPVHKPCANHVKMCLAIGRYRV